MIDTLNGCRRLGGARPLQINVTEEGEMSVKKTQQQKKTRSATTRRKAVIKVESTTPATPASN